MDTPGNGITLEELEKKETARMKEETPACGKEKYELGNMALVAGTFDYLGLEDLIDKNVGKTGSNVKVNIGGLVKALSMQMLHINYQSLMNTASFMTDIPCEALLRKGVTPDAFNRTELSRMLDDIYAFGTEQLFILCAKQVFDRLGITPHEVHIDSTSFHYDGQTREEEGCELILNKGYSRNHRPELNQAISVMLTDGSSHIPLWGKNVSGNVSDNTSFLNAISDSMPLLRKQFSELKYLVGDSALCTDPILKKAAKDGILIVTRLPDKTDLAKKCFGMLDENKLKPVYERQAEGEAPEIGMWCGIQEYYGTKLRLMLVKNTERRASKQKTVEKRANKELASLNSKLKTLWTQPCICMADAEKAVAKLESKLRLCRIDSVEYKEVQKNAKPGRPKKGETSEKVTVCVKVKAKTSIDSDKLAAAVDNEILYVIATNDLERNWTMGELLSTYRRQSVIERCWRCCKNPKMMVDAIYLQKPSRIDALLWLMEIALLVYAALEYRVRKVMKEKGLKLTGSEHRINRRPTGEFLLKHVSYMNEVETPGQ